MNSEKLQNNTNGLFDWTDKSKLRSSTKLLLNYNGDLKINFNQNVQKTFSKNGYFLAGPFSQVKDGISHLTLNDKQYYISKIYILAKEVIIKHEPFLNGAPITLRIPIISADPKNRKDTCIDRLLRSIPIVSFQLNNLLEDGGLASLYAGGTAIFLKTGISIQTTFPTKNTVNPFDDIGIPMFDPDYSLVKVHLGENQPVSKKEGFSDPLFNFIEGMEDTFEMDDDMECTPYDIGADNVQFMQVPIADETISGQTDKNTMYGILYLFYMGVIVMFLVFITPYLVGSTVSSITKYYGKNSNVMTNLKSLFVLFFAFIFVASIFITLDGSERHNVAESKSGLVIFFLAFACSAIFVVYSVVSGILKENDGTSWELGNVVEFMFECLPFKKFHKVFSYSTSIFIFFCIIIVIDQYLMSGAFSFSSYTITWGVFMSLTIGLFLAYLRGGIDLNEKLGNNLNYKN